MADNIDRLKSSKQRNAFFGNKQKFGIFRPADKEVTDGSVATSDMTISKRKAFTAPFGFDG